MALYLDSSFVLSILFEEDGYKENFNYFKKSKYIFTSIITELECIRNINRVHHELKKELHESWEKEKINILEKMISNINLIPINEDIKKEFYFRNKILKLKTLDAVHMASYSLFEKLITEELIFCTLDNEIKKYCIQNKINFWPSYN
ncbi:MAG: PIN domain-containing protein [Spirochaetia bacterium]|nr:PIN domain-containing protein [Spirochaetia bacterium]